MLEERKSHHPKAMREKSIIFDGFKRHNPHPPNFKKARGKSQTLNYRLQGLDIKRFIK
jgi:hypothetical protein